MGSGSYSVKIISGLVLRETVLKVSPLYVWEVGGGRLEVGGGRWEVGGGRWEV